MRRVIIAVFVVSLACSARAVVLQGNDFPYLNARLALPPQEEPFPGLGYNYSALTKGIETVKWNPAGLTSIKHAQSYLAFNLGETAPEYTRTFNTDDGSQTFSDNNPYRLNYYLTDSSNATAIATREHTGHGNYQTEGGGFTFGQAQKVNDWLTLGIVSQSRTGAGIDVIGQFPATVKTSADLTSASNLYGTSMRISDGFLTMTRTDEGGGSYSWTTQERLWSGFLTQVSTIPVTVVSNMRNDLSINPGITLAGAAKWQKWSFGASLTPISATCNVSNNFRAVVNDGTPDGYIYSPNVDMDDPSDAGLWVTNPDQYGTEAGYIRSVILVPAGQSIAEGRYQGFYSASAIRNDLGIQYAVSDYFTLGLALENFGGAALNFVGNGRSAYVNSRISTQEPTGMDSMPTADNPLEWNLFKETMEPVDGTESYSLQENVNIRLPQRTRLGLCLSKPFVFALDYEQNSAPIVYTDHSNARTITINNLTTLRLWTESRILMLPVVWKTGLSFLFKPTVTGLTAAEQSNLDNLFQFGIVPAGLTQAFDFNLWDTTVGLGFGLQPLFLLQAYQLDVMNQEMSGIGYYGLNISRGQWKANYLASVDPGATGGAYANRTSTNESFGVESVRWIQTISLSYTF